MLTIALPKGRLGGEVCKRLKAAGYMSGGADTDGRKLVLEDLGAGVRYLLVKPADVGVYVERGAADAGIAGRDILCESGAEVYELLDLGIGRCRLAAAAQRGFEDEPGRPLRVATKFVNIASRHYAAKGRSADIIPLHGSIELAPLVGLSDVIVDIVESGSTLRVNGLVVLEEIMPVSARFIANISSCKFKEDEINRLLAALKEAEK